jgi:hypothetical protein
MFLSSHDQLCVIDEIKGIEDNRDTTDDDMDNIILSEHSKQ